MPKLKTHKGASKRFKKTGTGKVVRSHAFGRHILTSKPHKRKKKAAQERGRRQGRPACSEADAPLLTGVSALRGRSAWHVPEPPIFDSLLRR